MTKIVWYLGCWKPWLKILAMVTVLSACLRIGPAPVSDTCLSPIQDSLAKGAHINGSSIHESSQPKLVSGGENFID